ncbi:MAG: DNA-processing protein DprA, partial [Bacteroidales bacterium]|nr:DNA-processing protein DprA [Candidatus Cryptobacteroides faecihippi]
RDLTSYGKEWGVRIVEAMSRSSSRPLVVSGLALGVDSVAHRSALDGGLPTVAVMATGIDSIYPIYQQGTGGKDRRDPRVCPCDGLPSRDGRHQDKLPPQEQDHRRDRQGHDTGGIEGERWRDDDSSPGRIVRKGRLRPAGEDGRPGLAGMQHADKGESGRAGRGNG